MTGVAAIRIDGLTAAATMTDAMDGDSFLAYVTHALLPILHPGDRLYLYTDGVTEAMSPAGELFGKARLLEILDRGRGVSGDESISMLTQEIVRWCASAARDDLSVLAVERESKFHPGKKIHRHKAPALPALEASPCRS